MDAPFTTRPRRALLASTAALGVLLGACGAPGPVGAPPASSPAAATTAGGSGEAFSIPAPTLGERIVLDGSVPVGPADHCGGLDQEAGSFTLLTPDDEVAGIVACQTGAGYLPGQGLWTVVSEHRVPDDELPALVDALRQPSFDAPQAPNTGCAAYAVVVPMFTVTTTDGRLLQGSVPSDGCHPQRPAVEALYRVTAEQPAIDRWRTAPIPAQDETTMTTGCGPYGDTLRTTQTLDEPTAEELTRRRAELAVPESPGGAAVCLYGPTGPVVKVTAFPDDGPSDTVDTRYADRQGAGRIDADLRDRLLGAITPTAPEGRSDCALSQPWPPAADGVTYLRLAGLPTTSATGVPEPEGPFLMVEVGPCGRVIDAENRPVGWVDAAVVADIRSAVT